MGKMSKALVAAALAVGNVAYWWLSGTDSGFLTGDEWVSGIFGALAAGAVYAVPNAEHSEAPKKKG